MTSSHAVIAFTGNFHIYTVGVRLCSELRAGSAVWILISSAPMLCILHSGIKKLPTKAAAQMSARNRSYHHRDAVIDFQDTGSLDQSLRSIVLESLQTERSNISKYENQKGQRLNSDSYLSLLVLIFCRHALKPLQSPLPEQTRDPMRSCVVAHITASQTEHDSPPGFSPSLHTTSGTVGWLQAPVEVCHCAL